MKELFVFFAICCVFQSCVTLKEHNKVKGNLNEQIGNKQSQLDSLKAELDLKSDKLKQLGNLKVSNGTSKSDEVKALSYKDDYSWVTLKNPERYKNYLIGGLGIIWLEVGKDSLTEGGLINLDRYNAKSEIIDQGDIIFKYFVNKEFSTEISAVSMVTASMASKDYAKLNYEILGTSRLKILHDSIESIAKKYNDRYKNKVRAVYLSTGFHVRKISLQTYTEMPIKTVATFPVASVNGYFYQESEGVINNWFVDAKLINLSIFVPNDALVQKKILEKEQTPYQFLISIFGKNIKSEDLMKVANSPELLTKENIEDLKNLLGHIQINEANEYKLDVLGKSLLETKTELLNRD
ncbi:hypothetical protein [Ulvibacterium sp.]|uniref:hypothetical protein n=1 Tax=Ulvibacterium sp. TaxID=2665914 RepID=UPI00262ACBA8|nr:hypothetical protein [Ulvibacterium sp.]